MKELELAMQVGEEVRKLPSDWQEDHSNNGKFTVSKSVPVPDVGAFGLVSLTGEITRNENGYSLLVRAGCLPLATEVKETAESLDEAKQKIEDMMVARASAVVLLHIVGR